MSSPDSLDIDQQLEEMMDAAGKLIETCRTRDIYEKFGEVRRLAKSEGRVMPYIWGTFFQMVQSYNLLEFENMTELALELIALFESEERARQIQADLPEAEYEYAVMTTTSCAYENLADSIGQRQGFNSDGMHACIADGIAVCRQTGKTECISCFREYACEVYTAAEDLEIARHQCQAVIDHPGPWSDRGDRRWLASCRASQIELLRGNRQEALRLAEMAMELAGEESVTIQLDAQLYTSFFLIPALIATGQPTDDASANLEKWMPERGISPGRDVQVDIVKSAMAAAEGNYDEAIELLKAWDRELNERNAMHLWFEVRLRLIALIRIKNGLPAAMRLVAQLESAAQKSCDWLTLRRLERLTDEDVQPNLFATLSEWIGPENVASDSGAGIDPVSTSRQETKKQRSEMLTQTPLASELEQLADALKELWENPTQEAFAETIERFLGYSAEQTTNPEDAGRLIYFATFVPAGDRARDVWQWANPHATPHREDAAVLSVLAMIGNRLRYQDEELANLITNDRLEEMHRKSMRLDSERAGNFLRAGDFFAELDNYGEAERCYARAFRLERTDSRFAIPLANVYRSTDRPKEALEVLDLALRKGCQDPEVAWEAGVLACIIDEFKSSLLYLERYERDVDETPLWLNYYRAVASLETGKPHDCLDAIAKEVQVAGEPGWHTLALRACGLAALDQFEETSQSLQEMLAIPIHQVDYLSIQGIEQTLQRVSKHLIPKLKDESLVDQFHQLLLATGMMPDSYFESKRTGEVVKGLTFFRCLAHQPLDDSWKTSPGCICGQQDWIEYYAEWGALAATEEEAKRMVLAYQQQCFSLPATIAEIQRDDSTFDDVPGVVWQGVRFGGTSDSEEDDDELLLE